MRGESKQYDNSNSGVLFFNDYKKATNHPDFKGNINITQEMFDACQVDGKLDIAAWKKEKNGKEFISITVAKAWKKDEAAAPSTAQKQEVPKASTDFDSDIPF